MTRLVVVNASPSPEATRLASHAAVTFRLTYNPREPCISPPSTRCVWTMLVTRCAAVAAARLRSEPTGPNTFVIVTAVCHRRDFIASRILRRREFRADRWRWPEPSALRFARKRSRAHLRTDNYGTYWEISERAAFARKFCETHRWHE